MKKFYMVQSEFYDNGTVKAAIIRELEAPEKPASTCVETSIADCYTDWYETRAAAEAAVKEARAA
ncbi:hypothetical protein AGMMS49944_21140 [Spirochaetia bacterium]|nr:hypothetical protein AGMMS49944_21140 [Spirochaetia bacterium]